MARALTILLCFAISPTSLAACLLPKDVDDFLVQVGDKYFFGTEAEVEIANRYFGVMFTTDEGAFGHFIFCPTKARTLDATSITCYAPGPFVFGHQFSGPEDEEGFDSDKADFYAEYEAFIIDSDIQYDLIEIDVPSPACGTIYAPNKSQQEAGG